MSPHCSISTPHLLDAVHLKQRIPLLDYLRRNHWTARRMRQAEFVGLCPLHRDTRPSFYVNARKNLFYCHGCGRGGDLIRLVELSQGLSFRQSLAYLQQQLPAADPRHMLETAAAFFQFQLHRHPPAVRYLAQRGLCDPNLIEALGIGYAFGGNLRSHLASFGYSQDAMRDIGLINRHGRDAFCQRVMFPCRDQGRIVNFYGRSVGAAFPHRLLPCSKGGLFAWDAVSRCTNLILVEGLLDLAVLWQAGFPNTTSAIGTHLTSTQFDQLRSLPGRPIYIVFDQDENQAGQCAAHSLAQRLEATGVAAFIVRLPPGLDPNSYFASGATAADFSLCLRAAQRL